MLCRREDRVKYAMGTSFWIWDVGEVKDWAHFDRDFLEEMSSGWK